MQKILDLTKIKDKVEAQEVKDPIASVLPSYCRNKKIGMFLHNAFYTITCGIHYHRVILKPRGSAAYKIKPGTYADNTNCCSHSMYLLNGVYTFLENTH